MATLLEIATINEEPLYGELLQKISAAVWKKAQVIADDAAATQAEQDWAIAALANTVESVKSIIPYVLSANDTATVAQILAASDASIQTNVDAAVEGLFGA